LLIYIPRGYLPGQELAPSSPLKGCQRVIEPDLSPLLYKPKPFVEELINGIATKFCFKYKALGLYFPN